MAYLVMTKQQRARCADALEHYPQGGHEFVGPAGEQGLVRWIRSEPGLYEVLYFDRAGHVLSAREAGYPEGAVFGRVKSERADVRAPEVA